MSCATGFCGGGCGKAELEIDAGWVLSICSQCNEEGVGWKEEGHVYSCRKDEEDGCQG